MPKSKPMIVARFERDIKSKIARTKRDIKHELERALKLKSGRTREDLAKQVRAMSLRDLKRTNTLIVSAGEILRVLKKYLAKRPTSLKRECVEVVKWSQGVQVGRATCAWCACAYSVEPEDFPAFFAFIKGGGGWALLTCCKDCGRDKGPDDAKRMVNALLDQFFPGLSEM